MVFSSSTGVNIKDFVEQTRVTRFGEPREKLSSGLSAGDNRPGSNIQEK